MAADRVSSLVAADLCAGVLAGCRHAADVDGMRGDCCGHSQATAGQHASPSWTCNRHRRLRSKSPSMLETFENLIDGKWTRGRGGAVFENENPAVCGSNLGLFQSSTPEDVVAADR